MGMARSCIRPTRRRFEDEDDAVIYRGGPPDWHILSPMAIMWADGIVFVSSLAHCTSLLLYTI